MSKLILSGKELRAIGYPEGPVISVAMQVMQKNYKHHRKEGVMELLKKILDAPVEFTNDAVLALIAEQLLPAPSADGLVISLNQQGIHFNVFGSGHIEEGAMHQMYMAAKLPVAVAGALVIFVSVWLMEAWPTACALPPVIEARGAKTGTPQV